MRYFYFTLPDFGNIRTLFLISSFFLLYKQKFRTGVRDFCLHLFYQYNLVLLSGHDSKKYQAALRLKKRIAENPAAFPDMGLLAETSEAREIDKFGEMAAKYVRKAQKRLTPEEIEEVIAEYLDGKTPTELGEKYGCHGATVSAILKRKGVNIRGHITEKADALIAGYQAQQISRICSDWVGSFNSTCVFSFFSVVFFIEDKFQISVANR